MLIVVIIIGVIYATATAVIRSKTDGAAGLDWSLERLDRTMRNAPIAGYLRLVCTGDLCEKCVLYGENGEAIATEIALFDEKPAWHIYDRSGYLEKREFAHDRCFEMERFANGAITDMLIEHKGSFYRYYAYLRPADRYQNYEEARLSIDPNQFLPTDKTKYYSEDD